MITRHSSLVTRHSSLFYELRLAVGAFLRQVLVELIVTQIMATFLIWTNTVLAEIIGDAFALGRQFAGIDERLDGEEQRGEQSQTIEDGCDGAETAIATKDETHGYGTHGKDTRAATHGIEHLLLFIDFCRFQLILIEYCFQRLGIGNLWQQGLHRSPIEEITLMTQFDAVILCHDRAVHLRAINESDILHLEVLKSEGAIVVERETEVLPAHRLVDTLLLPVTDILDGLALFVHGHEMEP